MCIVALAWKLLEHQPVLLLSNRDEYYARASQALAYWPQQQLYAGQDLQAGGTWQAVNAQGRWAVLTNYRDATDQRVYNSSRGHLLAEYLNSDLAPIRYARQLEARQRHYAGFNLLLGDRDQAVYLSNRGAAAQILANGIYVLSNGLMHEHWYKCAHLRQRFSQEFMPLAQLYHQHHHVYNQAYNHQDLHQPDQCPVLAPELIALAWDILEDRRQLPSDLLPNTGLSLAQEQLLSSTFIQSPDYGTRCSNLLSIAQHGLTWLEKNQDAASAAQIQRLDLRFAAQSATLLRYGNQHS